MKPAKILSLVLLAAAGAILPTRAQEADAQLEAYFKSYLEESFRHEPMQATGLGDHRFDHLLDDVSPQARAASLERTRKTLEELPRKVEVGRLSADGKIDYEIFRHSLVTGIWMTENTHPFEEDPRTYNSYISDSVYLLLAQSTLPRETNVLNSIARMARIPAVIEAARTTLKKPSLPLLETAIKQNRGAISFYEGGLLGEAGPTARSNELKAAAAPIAAALKDYQKFLETDLKARAVPEWRLGREKFARKLELVLDAGFTAEQVLADAEAEYARVQRDLYVVSRQLWSHYFSSKPLPPDDAQGRRETVARVLESVGHEHGRPEDLLRDAQATVARIKDFIRTADIIRLPEPDRCKVVEMPEFRRGNSLAYLDSAPPLEPAAASFYAISPPPSDWSPARVTSFLEEYNRHMLQILTIHEAYPGHYVQLEYSNRSRSLIRRVLQSGVFIEGWAVYTEQTMLDQGYGDRDLALRLSQLKFYLRAVVNAILDHKMHCTEMTDDEAMKLLTEGAYQSEGEAKLKIIRAKQSSTQLSTYFVGRMAHYRLRQQVQRELGDRFELGRYHEAVLSHGSIPMKYLPELVRARLNQPR